jgi:hypothetical protein
MSITNLISARRARNALVSLAIAGAGLGAVLGSAGAASAAEPHGIVTVLSASSVVGKTTYSPGLLTATPRPTTVRLNAILAGVSTEFGGNLLGSGTLTATLSGTASLGSENFSGTFVANWPGGTLNPSSGTVSVYDSNGTEYFEGTITSGAYTGAPIDFAYVHTTQKGNGTTAHPVVAQHFTNSSLLTVTVNDG